MFLHKSGDEPDNPSSLRQMPEEPEPDMSVVVRWEKTEVVGQGLKYLGGELRQGAHSARLRPHQSARYVSSCAGVYLRPWVQGVKELQLKSRILSDLPNTSAPRASWPFSRLV